MKSFPVDRQRLYVEANDSDLGRRLKLWAGCLPDSLFVFLARSGVWSKMGQCGCKFRLFELTSFPRYLSCTTDDSSLLFGVFIRKAEINTNNYDELPHSSLLGYATSFFT